MNTPNIIFIILDTLRGDKILSKYKNKNLNPYINNLLKNSIYFKNCIANSPWTLPSHISMFTGLYPTQCRVITKDADKLNNKIPILTEILNELGYYTICFTENAFINKKFGLTRGFDEEIQVWDWNPWIREKYKLSQIMYTLNMINLFIIKRVKFKRFLKVWANFHDRSEKIIKSIIKSLFLKNILFKLKNNTILDLEKLNQKLKIKPNNKPLYLFFNLLTTHDPYIPLKELFKPFNLTFKDFVIIKDILIDPLKCRLDVNIKSKRLNSKKVKVIKKLYDSCVSSCDIVIKKIFFLLKKFDLLETSFVIITSDHGEHLGGHLDHFLWEHSTYLSLYDGVIRVPLLIYNTNFGKRIINNQVQLKDIFHTILHLTGIPPDKNKYLDINKSILHQIDNNSTPKYIFGEFLKSKETIDIIRAHIRTINKNLIPKALNDLYFLRSNKNKYIKYTNNIEEFFDLSTDPYEQINIINDNNKIYRDMKLKTEKILRTISNPEELEDLITEREKDLIKKKIDQFKIKGI